MLKLPLSLRSSSVTAAIITAAVSSSTALVAAAGAGAGVATFLGAAASLIPIIWNILENAMIASAIIINATNTIARPSSDNSTASEKLMCAVLEM